MNTLPEVGSSKKLIHLIVVDFPEPDGPKITNFSPSLTRRLISFSTWVLPKNLL